MLYRIFYFIETILASPELLLLFLVTTALTLFVQIRVNVVYWYYKHKYVKCTGYATADAILTQHGIRDKYMISMIKGRLSDCYYAKKRIVFLSESVLAKNTISSIGIAAHEVGHALQHETHDKLFMARKVLTPLVNLSSNLSIPILFAGIFANSSKLAMTGIVLFSLATIFCLVTLPIEIDASRRGMAELVNLQIIEANSKEYKQVKKVLKAAAWTYIASLLASVVSLIRVIFVFVRSMSSH